MNNSSESLHLYAQEGSWTKDIRVMAKQIVPEHMVVIPSKTGTIVALENKPGSFKRDEIVKWMESAATANRLALTIYHEGAGVNPGTHLVQFSVRPMTTAEILDIRQPRQPEYVNSLVAEPVEVRTIQQSMF